MDADITDMKAPPVPRSARAAARAAVQDEPVDLAASTFRPTSHPVLGDLEQMQSALAALQAPIVAKLRDTLQRLHEVGSLGTTAENAQAAAMLYRLAKRCGLDFTYQGEPVALGFSKSERYKTGGFRLRTFTAIQKYVYDRADFPPLELTPADPAAHTSDNSLRPT